MATVDHFALLIFIVISPKIDAMCRKRRKTESRGRSPTTYARYDVWARAEICTMARLKAPIDDIVKDDAPPCARGHGAIT